MLLYLFVCCLIISRIEINVAETNSSTTVKSHTNGDTEGLLNIHAELLEIQDDVISIIKAIAQADNFDSIISKISVTEESLEHIENQLTNEIHRAAECTESVITMLTNHYDAVSAQMKNLRLNLNEIENKRLPMVANTTVQLKGLTFHSTHETSSELNNMTDALKIIKAVYANSSDSFDILDNIIESSTDIDSIYNYVRALEQEISTHNEKGYPYKWMRLVKIMEAGVINQLNVNPNTKAYAQDFVNDIYQSIRVFTVNALNAHVSTGAFERNGQMDNLTMAVYLFDPAHSEIIIEEFVNASFEHQYLKDIFDTILSHRFIQQRIKGLSVLFWKMKDSSKMNNDVTIDIASALYKIHSDEKLKTLSRVMRIGVKRIIENLPTCARNLYFLPSVCFWNRAKEEYLTAGNSTFKNDKARRNIFLSEDSLSGSHWYVERIGGNFLFSSRTYPNEYLYAADFNFNRDLRYLFSWIPGNNTDKQSNWKIQLNDDYCYIQSTTYYENMVSSNYKTHEGDLQLSYVYTTPPSTKMEKPDHQWQLRKCD